MASSWLAAPDWIPPAPYESPSGLSITGESIGHAMSEMDVADTIDAFARAAADAERLGFDRVELHGAHGYLHEATNLDLVCSAARRIETRDIYNECAYGDVTQSTLRATRARSPLASGWKT
ncbi:hypothetical protein [Paraburkholderia silvatlantica]|uniref:oxidoreductase n=1 Tax=Paraburkholderia silvatlantica TaxID=321895 RepID=UPI000DA258D7